ncbi:MAG: aldehyde dehydrogenase [Bacteroidetes bacterium CG23_combo_of_CG06-09_8_20_14_all_32_9]|nr:MAG: aldehyde dehydrogenase [Bacteroidetes bacterium CG23_combo_of_CG06-09_8_20_14_all_32_9]
MSAKYPIYVGGEFITTEQKLAVINSYSGEEFAHTYLAGKKELEMAIVKALAVKKSMRELPAYIKYEILMEIADKLKGSCQRLALVLAMEACKPLKYALGEINRAVQTFIIAAEETKRLPCEIMSLDWTPAGKDKEGIIKYFPVGLIAGIVPFNFPMNLAAHKIAPAIASGNCIIIKSSRSTPLSTLELATIINETALPKGVFSVLPMDRKAGQQLVTDKRFAMLTFTGSPQVGWKMKSQAGKKKITLELGGNAGVIVSPTANINLAVAKCTVGSFAYSGQVCIHIQRIYVHENIFDEFISKFTEIIKKYKIGKPEEPDTDISAMIDEENAIRVEDWVNQAVSGGAKILCGGKRKGTVYEPTILTNTKREMNVCCLEIFGPVVNIEKYKNFNEAVNLINDSEYGLQSGVFTNSIDEMNFAFREIETGGVMINDVPTFRVDQMPYGGVKNSGFGREGVKFAIHEMMEPKLLVKNV